MWSINEQGLPGTAVSKDEMEHLLNVSSFSRGAFSMTCCWVKPILSRLRPIMEA